ncbi:hypothetical protein N9N28_07940 [Rubripirellula amarantea]|uniref:Uncharacterized protein n=1 Tax=Rubripirellula amarantea TaxID=2527999 RepID=A0A5C5WR88_9BACT|nr:hypothetical protein [Rubripirellula amarantea]MDA8744547.1 hypothetical protein [Rubripirellula amarantea]TWT53088.1 hypothetical protein Pla22_07160 [Rubripirellula amarantea]
MSANEQKRQKKLAKKRSKELARKKEVARQKNSLQSLAGKIKAAAEQPIDRCFASENLFNEQDRFGTVFISRRMADGQLACVRLLIDGLCLGVKHADAIVCFPTEANELIDRIKRTEDMRVTSPPAARKLVEGAIEFAQQFGFEPHPQYAKFLPIWNGVDASECMTEFEFGRDGKPVYISGPDDTPESASRIAMQLAERAGEGNFEMDYDAAYRLGDLESDSDWVDDPELDVDIDEDVPTA